ncbi:MAG: copper amine oxidase N-terminal domain-containing protein [Clostridia bacterium]|nr:copper amine oxidase N-terminal domain-containing protein [Clostridia bacterium]
MKKILLFFISIVSLLIMSSVYAAEVEVQVNGTIIDFDDTTAQIINNRTMVPFRKIFNELGVANEDITWNGESKTIIAKKKNIEIELQIGNNVASKKENGNSSDIILDSAPVIKNDRTLVPLRFIAESLGKTVGWDAANKTAVIIDFDYFLNLVNNKSNSLYQFLTKNSSNMNVSITRNYIDGDDNTKNNTAIVTANIVENKNEKVLNQNVRVKFSGTNELMKEIATEGWADIQYENNYYDDYFTTKALTDGLKKVYAQEQLKFMYDGLKCEGKNSDSISELLNNICDIDEKSINTETFKTLKEEFDTLLNSFKNANGFLTTGNISSEFLKLKYFDFTKLDNVLYDSPLNRVYSLLNTQIFNFDVTLEELCYDYPKVNLTINTSDSELTIEFILSNEYHEKVEYRIVINK